MGWVIGSSSVLAIIPQVYLGYDLDIIMSYPRVRGIIVLFKTTTKYREFLLTLFVCIVLFYVYYLM